MGWSGRAPARLARKLWGFEPRKEHAPRPGFRPLPRLPPLGIDLGKNSFHLVVQDERGAVLLRIKRYGLLERGRSIEVS